MKCHYANALLNLLIKFLTYSKKHLFTVKKYLKTFWKNGDNLTAINYRSYYTLSVNTKLELLLWIVLI